MKAAFALPAFHRDTRPKTQPRSELLRMKMLDTGDLLIDALRLEQDLSGGEGLEQGRACRAILEHLAQDHASAVAARSEAVEDDFQPAELRLGKVH